MPARHHPDRWWVYDRPLLRDGMLWVGLTAGSLAAWLGTSSGRWAELSILERLLMVGGRLVSGVLIVGVVGGSIRNFLRAYRNDTDLQE